MAAISVEQFMPYAMFKPSSLMAFCVWVSRRMIPTKRLRSSKFISWGSRYSFHVCLFRRQRREHRVFGTLLQMVPGIEDRLMNDPDESETVKIAELVSRKYPFHYCIYIIYGFPDSEGHF